jgi:hypothetical protein
MGIRNCFTLVIRVLPQRPVKLPYAREAVNKKTEKDTILTT